MPSMPDRRLENLFDRFREHGDVAALASVFDETAPELLRVARHLARDHGAAEDLVQGTFVAAMEKRASFDSRRELLPWLVGILLKQASLARRALARVIEPERLDPPTSEDPLEVAAARELSDALAAALAKLDPIDRAVLIPLLLDGRRAVEIARELGRRPDTIHMRIHRSLGRLRRLLPASFALGALVRSGHARGLSAVRTEVLRHARIELGLAGAGGAAATLATAGIIMTTKKLSLVLAVIVLCVATVGYLAATKTRGSETVSSSPNGAQLAQGTADGSRGASNVDSARAEALIADSRGSLASTRESEALELEVVREDREPVREARVVVVDSAGVLASAKTDANGRCSLPGSTNTADVYVREDARLPYHTTIEVAAGRRTIELPRGGELSGRLQLTSGEPLPPIELRLSTDTAPAGFAKANLGVFRALGLVEYDTKDVFARTQSGANGSFRFCGLTKDWSGSLRLPMELMFALDSVATGSNERAFPSAMAELNLPVVFRPRIIGRLVDVATGVPVESHSNCSIKWSDGTSMVVAVRSGVDGRFTIALDGRTDAKELEFGRVAGGRLVHATVPVAWEEASTLFDAGDIECELPASRRLVFHAVAADGKPLVGVRAQIGELDFVDANENGVGVFPAVPLDEKELLVAAAGYAITSVALAPDTASPVEVRLEPTNLLTVALPVEVAERRNLRLALISKEPLFRNKNRIYDSLRREGMLGRCTSASGYSNGQEGRVVFAFSPDGRIELEGIRTAVPFRVRLTDSRFVFADSEGDTLAEVAVDALGAGEQRRIELSIDPAQMKSMKLLRIRAVNEHALPVFHAGISVQWPGDLILGHTDLDGRFGLEMTAGKPANIQVQKRGFVPFRALRVDASTADSLEARLVRGRDLRVEVVDTTGRPVDVTRLSADITGFGPPWKIEDSGTGVFTLCDLPPGVAEITAEVGGRKYTRSQDTGSNLVRVVLPVPGALEVRWPVIGTADDTPRIYYRLALRPMATTGEPLFHELYSHDPSHAHTFAALAPGEYSLALESAARSGASDDLVYAAMRAPIKVTIVAGETQRIELGL
jgi:RNA polymerase sigma-70 factor (ECF subfamily)